MNITPKRWVTLFSQTGSEIAELSARLGRSPDLIVSTQQDTTRVSSSLDNLKATYVTLPRSPSVENYEAYFKEGDLITLHGFLRIVPPTVCNSFTIFNGHPGLITNYLDLKGKDPQVRAYKADYRLIGSVVHRCTEELDSGLIFSGKATYLAETSTLEDYYAELKKTSLEAWLDFFDKYIKLA